MVAEIYLVGQRGATKANSFDAMTNSLEEAKKLMPQGGEMKVIKVTEGRRK